ncbi:alpha/beta hydrolase [Sphingobium fluviale]|jgi:acetyl esterase/lipase|uniref:Alpha/beta hydrolase n=1 Tax=Sphingobium fluviale TaxID=2506423 RepID=A0A4Q1KLF9_9SPHN|nr:alpha/beta hydrolase [Sphingobium fluviale]RXR30781.1 alpha/beta hydrolase [Sphingobium fluviale]
MKRRRLFLGALGLLAGAASIAAWKPLTAFNLLVPKDDTAGRVQTDLAYGPLPRQRLDIYRPVRPDKNLPVIVFLYGGAWDSGRRQDYAFVGQALASRGYLVVIPDYRLVPEVRFPDFLRDCALALQWTRANAAKFGGDGDRVVLAGHSAGAYNAAMLALDPRWLGGNRTAVRGLVTLAGPFDILPLDDPASIAAFSHWPRLQETQPVHFANPNALPVLLLHGADDNRVRPRNSLRLKAELDRVGAKADLHLYPDMSHAGILLALAQPLRGTAPALNDIDHFTRRVTR